ncbi:hypothetical protein [Tumebacillus lipolyticus]|uniref:Transporter n=1 Tax=Tumebacillus lipolyticus TaxID=1280370 RepID=A0ABW4ZX72_9BACL
MTRRKKRAQYEDDYREIPAVFYYDPRFFPGMPGPMPGPGGGTPFPPPRPPVFPTPGPFPGFPATPGPGGVPGGGPAGVPNPPTTPPPNYTPKKPFTAPGAVKAIDPGAIQRCRFRFVYLWLDNGQQFWAFPTFIGPRSLAGYRWNGFRWIYFGVDLRHIDSFICT